MSEECTGCKNYTSIPKMQEQIKNISKEDVKQNSMLEDATNSMSEIRESISGINSTLAGHMKWEELFQKVMVGGMLLTAPVAVAYMAWQFLEHTSKKEVAAKHNERIENNKDSIYSLGEDVKDMRKTFKQDLKETVETITEHNTGASKTNYKELAEVIRNEIKKGKL